MKQHSAEYLAWYKFLYVQGLTTAARKLIYQAICEKKITIEELFIISEYEFYEFFPAFGKGEFKDLKYQNFQATHTKEIQKRFEYLWEDTFFIPLNHPSYPQRIKQRLGAAAPPAFFGRGHLPLVNNRNIAVLGSDDANSEEIKLTWRLCTHFVRRGYNVLSNHSWGISEHAHKSALIADGTITSVLATGFYDFWVRNAIQIHGYEINSFFLTAVLPEEISSIEKYEERSKLIAAWSEAVVVVKSNFFKDQKTDAHGNIAAAHFALENNIPVFLPSKKVLSSYSSGNFEISCAGGIDFNHPKEITSFLQRQY